MDFAKKELEKYGWKDGEGLGKTGSGIARPIKPKLKYDNAGLGHKIADDLINPWWQRVYDSAAKNVIVSNKGGEVVVATLGDEIEISTKKKKKSKKCANSVSYGNFIMRANLTSEGETSITDEMFESEVEPSTRKRSSGICDMTDEELFSVCGGRTVHKGARHGLSMSAKLARLEEQELWGDRHMKPKKIKKKKEP